MFLCPSDRQFHNFAEKKNNLTMSITDRFPLEFDEGLANVPENDANIIALIPPRPGPNLHVSPDEAVIQARGRRRMPASFSPERETIFQVFYLNNPM